jgi:P4 family phage/plasmid primase-like protien
MPSREELLQGALEAAANGWKVAPIAVGAKVGARGRSWKSDATSDPNRIRELWADTPYNVAGVTGRYLVIDVDVAGDKQGAESLERIVNEFGYLDTRMHRSPTGGFHYIYECPPDWALTHKAPLHRDYPGIDLRAGTSYIVLPPSETDVGRYWVETDIAPEPAPDWIKMLHDGGSGIVAETSSDRVRLDEIPPGMEGARNVTLTRLAGRLRREGNSPTHITAQLKAYQAEWRNPVPMPELLQIAASADRWAPDVLGGIAPAATDHDNATLVRLVSDNNLLFRAEDLRWTVWDGRKWGIGSFRGGYAEEAIVVLEDVLDRTEGELLTKLLRRKIAMLKSANGRKGMWQIMPDLPGVTQLNDAFDENLYLLNTASGVVDLRTGLQAPHDKRLMLTKMAGSAYDPEADMVEWEKFVLWCCSGDMEQAYWLKVALGSSLIGEQREALILFMFGPGKNGKSQLTDAIRLTLGDYGLESTADLLTAKGKDSIHTEAVASLAGARFVTCSEPEKGSYWAAARVKAITGGDRIRARHLFGREFSFKPSHTLVVHGNYQPEIRDPSEGFRRRLRLVPFTNHVTSNIEVKNLGQLLAGPGVLRWLVEGARDSITINGLPACQRVDAATGNYFDDQNQFARWRDDCAEVNDEVWDATADMYLNYRWWAEREGIRFIETKQVFAAWLSQEKYRPMTRRRNGAAMRGFLGIGLLSQAVDDLPA